MDTTLTSPRTGSGPRVSFPSDPGGAACRNSLRTTLVLSLQGSLAASQVLWGWPREEWTGRSSKGRGEGRGVRKKRRRGKEVGERDTEGGRKGRRPGGPGHSSGTLVAAEPLGDVGGPWLGGSHPGPRNPCIHVAQRQWCPGFHSLT